MRRRVFALLAAVSLLLCVAILVLWVKSYRPGPPAGPSTARLQAVLARVIPALQFDAVGFGDVLEFMGDVTGEKVEVDWAALEAVGVQRHAPVSYKLSNVPTGSALAKIVAVGGDGGLEYSAEGDVLCVFTKGARPPHGGGRAGAVRTRPAVEFVRGSRRWTFAADVGTLRLWLTPPDPASTYQGPGRHGGAARRSEKLFEFGGVSVHRRASLFSTWAVAVPLWALVFLTALPPLLGLAGARRRLRRSSRRMCPRCGYDLTGNISGVCPECGQATPAAEPG